MRINLVIHCRTLWIIPLFLERFMDAQQICPVFVLQHSGNVIPLEVKAEENLQAKSLKHFVAGNELPFGVRTSMSDYRKQDKLINLPLYAISQLWEVCDTF